MDDQDQRGMDGQRDSQVSDENQSTQDGAGFSNPEDSDDQWGDDDGLLDDQTGRQMLYWIGGGVMILVVVAALFLIFGGNSGPTGDLADLNKQIRKLEARLSTLEASAESWTMNMDSLEKGQQTAIDQTNKLWAKVNELGRESVSKPVARPKASPAKIAPAPVPTPKIETKPSISPRRFHMVKKGDTLYSIYKKYKVPLDKLRKINSLKEHQPIFTGQKIYLE